MNNLQSTFPQIIKANEHFDPATCPYEVHGFYEDYVDLDTLKSLGSRTLPDLEAPRATGSPGIRNTVLTEPVTLVKGLKTVTIKASRKHPRRVQTMIMILCGKRK